ncbi:hypothetical protein ES703_81901 [subsurface metagenome]
MYRGIVDVDHARLQPLGYRQPLFKVAGDDACRKSVAGVISQGNGFISVPGHYHRSHRAKGFLAEDLHIGGDLGEHGRVVTEPLVLAAAEKLGALVDGFFYLSLEQVKLPLIDERPNHRIRLAWVADLEFFYLVGELLDKVLGNGLFHDNSF